MLHVPLCADAVEYRENKSHAVKVPYPHIECVCLALGLGEGVECGQAESAVSWERMGSVVYMLFCFLFILFVLFSLDILIYLSN